MTAPSSPPGYRVITAEEAEARFAPSGDLAFPYQSFTGEQQLRVYEGGLHVDGDFKAESDGDWVLYNVIVDGDLTVAGDVEWYDWSGGNFLLVNGNLRARNVLLSGCPDVVVRGDLTARGAVQGHHGDDGGYLTVLGLTRAEVIISTTYFNLDFGPRPEALLIAAPSRTTCDVDYTDEQLADLVLPELVDEDGRADEYKIGKALSSGLPVLRPEVRAGRPVSADNPCDVR
jgi:hypothetical protein